MLSCSVRHDPDIVRVEHFAPDHKYRQTTYPDAPDTETDGDEDDVLCDGKCADYTVEAEACIEHFKVQERHEARHAGSSNDLACVHVGRFLPLRELLC